MSDALHAQVATLVDLYRRDLRRTTPSDDLDARIGDLVAGRVRPAPPRVLRRAPRGAWAAVAATATVAIAAGIFIGVLMERGTRLATIAPAPANPPVNFSMWPSDSVALQVPAEYSRGSLVAVDPHAAVSGKRYWVDVVVSNDGTVRIDQIVPVDPKNTSRGTHDGITLQQP